MIMKITHVCQWSSSLTLNKQVANLKLVGECSSSDLQKVNLQTGKLVGKWREEGKTMVFLFFCKIPAASLPTVPPFTFRVQKLQNKPTSLRGDEIKPNDRADHSQNQNLNFLFQNLEESLLKMISSEKDQNRKSVLPSTSRNSPKQ